MFGLAPVWDVSANKIFSVDTVSVNKVNQNLIVVLAILLKGIFIFQYFEGENYSAYIEL